MATYLVVAHQTATSQELRRLLKARSRESPGATFVLLVPATPAGQLPWDEGKSREVAEARAQEALAELREAGINVVEARSGEANPLAAIERELEEHSEGYDSLIISTHPPGISRWLGMDIVSQATRRFGLPVTHCWAAPEPVLDEPEMTVTSPACSHDRVRPFWDESLVSCRYRCLDCNTELEELELPDGMKAWRP